jgi:DNA modification methylase
LSPEYETVAISDLMPDPANVRTHSKRNIAAISASLKKFGQQKPIVVGKDGLVIAGNGTLEAAVAIGWDKIKVRRSDLAGSDAAGYAIADNRTGELAEWDEAGLAKAISALDGVDPEDIGFSEADIRKITPKPLIEDEAPEPPKNPVTKLGDVWTLGDHRLICGDATNKNDVANILMGDSPFLMVTDPPYGVNYDPEWRKRAGLRKGGADGAVSNDDRANWSGAYSLFLGGVLYAWSPGGDLQIQTGQAILSCGFQIRSMVIWKKARFAISRGAYHWAHEPCWYAVREGKTANWIGDRKQSTVWDIPHIKNETGHGTQKPVECMARPIRNHDAPIVYDPFVGSGTTIIAAEQLDRRCLAIEIDPAYCDVSVERWETLTGGKAARA